MLRLTDIKKKLARTFRAGETKLAAHKLVPNMTRTLSIESPDFVAGGPLPRSAAPPVIVVGKVPREAKALVLICEGPDAPMADPFVHWLLFGVAGHDLTIDADVVATALTGKNSKLTSEYAPPMPPRGGGIHHYHFQVFALDDELAGSPEKDATLPSTFQDSTGVLSGAGRSELIEQMRGHVIAWGEIVGTQER